MKKVLLISILSILPLLSFSQHLYFTKLTTNTTGGSFSMRSQSGIHLGEVFETTIIQSGEKYKAEKVKEKTEDKSVVVSVVNSKYKEILFESPDAFISYMSDLGYELAERSESESGIECKFIKANPMVEENLIDAIQD